MILITRRETSAHPGTPLDPLRNFGFLLREVSSLSALNFMRYADELGLSLAQCRVLTYLQRNEGISQARLATLTDTDPMTLARMLERMESDGWIRRSSDPSDGRAWRLFLKSPATAKLQEIWRVADRARSDAMTGLSAADRTQLMALLERVKSNLNNALRTDA